MEHITRNDPRIQQFLSGIDLAAQVRDIIAGVRRGDAIPGVMDMAKIEERVAQKKNFVRLDLECVRVESYEINGHVVFWLFVKIEADPNTVFSSVIPKGLGQILNAAEVEYWAELDPQGEYQRVWGVWVKNVSLTPSTTGYYQVVVPKRWNDALKELRARKSA